MYNTKVTSIGAKRLQEALPNTRISPISSNEAGNTEKKERLSKEIAM